MHYAFWNDYCWFLYFLKKYLLWHSCPRSCLFIYFSESQILDINFIKHFIQAAQFFLEQILFLGNIPLLRGLRFLNLIRKYAVETFHVHIHLTLQLNINAKYKCIGCAEVGVRCLLLLVKKILIMFQPSNC